MKTQKCIECATAHHNSGGTGKIEDRCFNCKIVFDMLEAFMKGINYHVPINGRPRKLTITSYKIEKV